MHCKSVPAVPVISVVLEFFMLLEGDLMYYKFCPHHSRYPHYALDFLIIEMSLKVQLLVECDGYN